MKKLMLSLLLAMMMVLVFVVPVLADAGSSQEVEVTATPALLAIANTPGTWAPNDIVGDGVTPKGTIAPDTPYYTNPLGDELSPALLGDDEDPITTVDISECLFAITNTSSVAINLTVNFPDFANGDAMANANADHTGTETSAGSDTFVAWSYYEGMLLYGTNKVLAKATESEPLITDFDSASLGWGLELQTQTDDWTSGTAMVSTVTITASYYMP
jgi:hypothetical protein